MSENKKNSRQGKRAPGIVLMSVPMSEALRDQIKEIAEHEQLTVSAWVRFQMLTIVRRSLAARKAAEKRAAA